MNAVNEYHLEPPETRELVAEYESWERTKDYYRYQEWVPNPNPYAPEYDHQIVYQTGTRINEFTCDWITPRITIYDDKSIEIGFGEGAAKPCMPEHGDKLLKALTDMCQAALNECQGKIPPQYQ